MRYKTKTCGCRCTRLTSLELIMHDVESYQTMFTVGGLPEGISVLQRLQYLRLSDCVTAPLTHGISQLTQLTRLDVHSGDLCDAEIYAPPAVVVRRSSPYQELEGFPSCATMGQPADTPGVATACGEREDWWKPGAISPVSPCCRSVATELPLGFTYLAGYDVMAQCCPRIAPFDAASCQRLSPH
jgi:hypothetical protein